jgi:hypothetical protein
LPSPIFLCLAPWCSSSGSPPSDFGFQLFSVSAFCFVPVEQRALGLLLAGGDFDEAPNGMGKAEGRRFLLVAGPYSLVHAKPRR